MTQYNNLNGDCRSLTVEELCAYDFTNQMQNYLGVHVFAEFWNCNIPIQNMEEIIKQSAQMANSTILKYNAVQFDPQGFTAFAILAESHISIHTWPEENYCALDVFTCGEHTSPGKALQYLKEVLKPTCVDLKIQFRGKKSGKRP